MKFTELTRTYLLVMLVFECTVLDHRSYFLNFFDIFGDLNGIGAKNSFQELVPSFLLATTLAASPSGSSELVDHQRGLQDL